MKKNDSASEHKTNWREERLPFLREMYEEDVPSKSESNNKSGSGWKTWSGTRKILGRWPVDITVMSLSFGVALILTAITALTFLFIFSSPNNKSHKLATKTGSKVLELETNCDYQYTEDETLNKHRRIRRENILNSAGFQYTSSFETERSDISNANSSTSTEHKIFFVTTDNVLSTNQLFAVESAADIMSDYNLYIIILSINNTDINTASDKRLDELRNKYPNVNVFRLKGDRYFYDSPFRDILHKSNFSSSLIVFAARVLTLWRYGGITYGLDLITLRNDNSRTYPISEDASIMISRNEGAVMSAGRKCHEFLYTLMTTLTSLYGKRRGSCDLCSKDVLKYALRKFCYNENKKPRPGTRIRKRYFDNCNGISVMPDCLICNDDEESNTDCIWTSSTARSYNIRRKRHPVLYQHTPEETSIANEIALSRERKFPY
jgi:hypothetical protein